MDVHEDYVLLDFDTKDYDYYEYDDIVDEENYTFTEILEYCVIPNSYALTNQILPLIILCCVFRSAINLLRKSQLKFFFQQMKSSLGRFLHYGCPSQRL